MQNTLPLQMQTSEIVVILGCSIKNVGGAINIPSMLLMRLKKCLEVINQLRHERKKFIVIATGGGSFKQTGHSESSVMKRWLVEHGVNENLILEETQSMNTYENARNTANILRFFRVHPTYDGIIYDSLDDLSTNHISISSIVIGKLITSDFHIERSELLFKHFLPEIKFDCVRANTPESEKELRTKMETQFLIELKKHLGH